MGGCLRKAVPLEQLSELRNSNLKESVFDLLHQQGQVQLGARGVVAGVSGEGHLCE